MPTVLITGSFGNVGVNVIRRFHYLNGTYQRKDNPLKVKIVCFDLATPLTKKVQSDLIKEFKGDELSFTTIWGDICDKRQVKEAIQGVDAVIHLAAIIPPAGYSKPDLAKRVNVDGTINIVQACTEVKGDKKPRIVFASSYSIHGNRNYFKDLPLLNSRSPFAPIELYGRQKVEAEKEIIKYVGEWVILRLGAVSFTQKHALSLSKVDHNEYHVYGIGFGGRRHGIHSCDAARAFATAAVTTKPVSKKILMAGGDSTWACSTFHFNNIMYRSFGLGIVTKDIYRRPSVETAFHYEDWMDTSEAQYLLDFQKHTILDWYEELRAEMGVLYYFAKLIAPIARFFIKRNSPYYAFNIRNIQHHENTKSLSDLCGLKLEGL